VSRDDSQKVRICVGGDVVPVLGATPLFVEGNAGAVFGGLLDRFAAAHVTVVNLECPLIERPSPEEKAGRILGAPTASVNALSEAGLDAVGLANNHVMDHGAHGLENTLRALGEAGIGAFGAGRNIADASRPLVFERSGIRIALMGVAEHEFCIAGERSPGACPLDAARFVRAVEEHRSRFDLLVVLVHGGMDYYPYPSPRLADTCRFFVERGASAVLCQHSHTPGCHEIYRDGLIVYGQGNLVFDTNAPRRNGADWHRGFLVEVELTRRGLSGFDLVPYVQFEGEAGVREMDPSQGREFLAAVQGRSEEITVDGRIAELWREHCETLVDGCLSDVHGDRGALRWLNLASRWLRLKYRGRSRLRALNAIRRETHREVLETILRRR